MTRDPMSAPAPDEWGAWAKAEPRKLRDVFPTPAALQAAAHDAVHSVVAPRRYTAHLTSDGAIAIDHETGDTIDLGAPVRITREQWRADPDRWTAESEMRAVEIVDADGRVRMTLSGWATEETDR